MTRFLEDILRQPDELLQAIGRLDGPGRQSLEASAELIRSARHVYLTGIGASWNAALGAGAIFHGGGQPVYMQDAAELLHFSQIPRGAVIVILSRSGKSVEIVQLLAKAHEAGATVIGVTNFEDGLLAQEAALPVVIPVKSDNGISVNTYSTLALAAAAIATATVRAFDAPLVYALSSAIAETAKLFPDWQQRVNGSAWLRPDAPYLFLARGSSLSTAYEAGLLWEEGVKIPALAMGTGSFRHGPQEMIRQGTRAALWLHETQMREQDLAVVRDLRALGASVMLTGCNLPPSSADLLFELPRLPEGWQFLTDIFPTQFAAERLSKLAGSDCDSFRFASYIVEDDSGLLPGGAAPSVNSTSGTQ